MFKHKLIAKPPQRKHWCVAVGVSTYRTLLPNSCLFISIMFLFGFQKKHGAESVLAKVSNDVQLASGCGQTKIWFRSYLTNHYWFVSSNGDSSERKSVAWCPTRLHFKPSKKCSLYIQPLGCVNYKHNIDFHFMLMINNYTKQFGQNALDYTVYSIERLWECPHITTRCKSTWT